METLQASQIDEDDYFCHVTHKTWDAILHDLRTAHADDTESAPDSSNASSVIKRQSGHCVFPEIFLMYSAMPCVSNWVSNMKSSRKGAQ